MKKFEVLTALRHLGCELTDSDRIFIREETSKLQNSTSLNGFNITDSLNDFGKNILITLHLKIYYDWSLNC